MLLARKEVFRPTSEQQVIFGHLGYAAFKLWNIGNYEKRNFKELGMEKFPNWYDQKKRLKDHFFYKNLPSQTAQDVLQQLQEAWNSFFALRKTGGVANPKPPRFRNEKMPITFLKDAIKQQGDSIRLSIPKQLKQYLDETKGMNANYIYLKTRRFSDIRIKELQVQFGETDYTAIAVYDVDTPKPQTDNGHYLAIDLGIRNTFTCYDTAGQSFIIRGFLAATHYYDKEIARLQSISDRAQVKQGVKYPKKTRRVRRLYQKKRNCVHDFLHKSTRYITDYCREQDISKVIIGDLTNIRKDVNLGRHNQQLHALPYRKLYGQLNYKLALSGIVFIRQPEAYSSQCSPESKEVSKECARKSNRVHRGLYKDKHRIYNADCVGAYNIGRLYCQRMALDVMKPIGLDSPQKVSV